MKTMKARTKMCGTVFLNGDFLPVSQARVSVLDRGFIFGDGVYEVAPVVAGVMVDREDFYARLARSLEAIELALPWSPAQLEEILRALIATNKLTEGGVYLQLTRGAAERDFGFIAGLSPTVFAYVYEASVLVNSATFTAISTPDLRWRRRDIKSISLLAQCLAKTAAARAGADEAWMFEADQGEEDPARKIITEGSATSAFIIKNKTLITRPLSQKILSGIRRKKILGFAAECGLGVEEREFSLAEVYAADEAFVSAATLLLIPVLSMDGRAIGGGVVGEFVPRLRAKYVERVLAEANS